MVCLTREGRTEYIHFLLALRATEIYPLPKTFKDVAKILSQLCHGPVVTYCMVYHYTKRVMLARLLANKGPAIYLVHLNRYFVIPPWYYLVVTFLWQIPADSKKRWLEFCLEKLKSLKNRDVYKIMDLFKRRKTVKNHWVFNIKPNSCYWFHLVAKEFS